MDGAVWAELIADAAAASGGAPTRLALARRLAEAFARHAPLVALELGWREPGSDRAATARASHEGERWRASEGSRRLRGTALLEALEPSRPEQVALGRASRRADEREARAAGARALVTIPLGGADRTGYAALALTRASPLLSEPQALALLARALGAAHRGCVVLERVASNSRAAHQERAALRRELERLHEERGLVARSPAMRDLLTRLDAVAPHETTVLLLGESGTGKSLLARRLHARSARASGPLVTVNCGALPEALVESELFGHEAGAFTGAVRARRGRFELARGGTLFLDEVGELPPAAQVKLLRALQEGEVEPLGGERTVKVDVRVVAATNRPLAELVARRRFREDLYYRLATFPLTVPPLRERREDAPELIEALLSDLEHRLGRPVPRPSQRALRALLAHSWPGNVRELANVLERAAILSRGSQLALADVLAPSPADGSPASASEHVETFADASRRCIAAALRAAGGRIYGPGGAAERLGLKPSTLQTKMTKLGLRRRDFAS